MKKVGGLRDVRRIYDMYDVLGLDGHTDKIVCPLPQHPHHNYTPSFHIYSAVDSDGHTTQRFQCHGACGLFGDVIDLVGYMHIPGYNGNNPEHVRDAVGLLSAHEPVSVPKVRARKAALPQNKWREYLPPGPEVITYARKRGLHENTLKHFKVGQYKHYMSMPVFEEGLLKAIKFRSTLPDAKLRFWAEKGSAKALFNYDAVAYKEFPILFLKGEIPVMLMHQLGFMACAPVNGEASNLLEEWANILAFSRRIVVVGDNDPNPRTRKNMQEKARQRAEILRADLRFPPEQYKDIDEWVLDDPSAVEEIWRWLMD